MGITTSPINNVFIYYVFYFNIWIMNLQDLKKEMPFKWRVQSTNQYACTCVAYIDARDVQDLLDEVVGAAKWQTRYSEHKGNLFCEIGVWIDPIGWVGKSDCGTESQVEKQKGEASDAFKRAAVMWGIGRFLYSLGIIKIKEVEEKNGKYYPTHNGQKIWDINKHCNDLHNGNKIESPVITKKVERKPAFKAGGYEYLISDKATKEHRLKALEVNRMTPDQKSKLESLTK